MYGDETKWAAKYASDRKNVAGINLAPTLQASFNAYKMFAKEFSLFSFRKKMGTTVNILNNKQNFD